MMPNNGIMRAIFWVIGISFLAIWIRVGWVLFYPYKPLVVHSHKIVNEGKQVKAGGVALLESTFTKYTEVEGYVSRQLINKFVYYLPTYKATNPSSVKRMIVIEVDVPLYAIPGPYRIYTTYTYRMSDFPRRDVTVPVWSEPFEVIAPDPPEYKQGKAGPKGPKGDPGKGFWGK